LKVYVIDASVAIKWLFEEVHQPEARRYLTSPYNRIAPDIIVLEIASAIQKKVRLGTIQTRLGFESVRLLQSAESLILFPFAELLERAYQLATELNHAVYDCLYLALALNQDAILVTADRKFFDRVTSSPYKNRIAWVQEPPQKITTGQT